MVVVQVVGSINVFYKNEFEKLGYIQANGGAINAGNGCITTTKF